MLVGSDQLPGFLVELESWNADLVAGHFLPSSFRTFAISSAISFAIASLKLWLSSLQHISMMDQAASRSFWVVIVFAVPLLALAAKPRR